MSDLPEPIATARRRMEYGFTRLTDNEATRLLECATAEFHRAERLQLALDSALASSRDDAEFARVALAKSARLERVNRRLWWGLIAAVSVVLTLSALWSCYAGS